MPSWQEAIGIFKALGERDVAEDIERWRTLTPGVGIVTLGKLLETGGRLIPQAHLELARFSKP